MATRHQRVRMKVRSSDFAETLYGLKIFVYLIYKGIIRDSVVL